MLTASRRLQCLVQESTQAPRVRKAYCHFACQSCVYGRFIRVRRSARAINGNGHTCNQWGGDDAVVRRDRRTPHDPMPSRRRGLRLIRAHDPNHHALRQPAIAALLWSGGEPVAPLRCSGSRGAPPPARFPGSRDAYRRGNFSSPVTLAPMATAFARMSSRSCASLRPPSCAPRGATSFRATTGRTVSGRSPCDRSR